MMGVKTTMTTTPTIRYMVRLSTQSVSQRAVLERLIENIGEPVSQDDLSKALYGMADTSTRHNMKTIIYRLRRRGYPIDTIPGGYYCLAPGEPMRHEILRYPRPVGCTRHRQVVLDTLRSQEWVTKDALTQAVYGKVTRSTKNHLVDILRELARKQNVSFAYRGTTKTYPSTWVEVRLLALPEDKPPQIEHIAILPAVPAWDELHP